jgi:hypothetical protein
MIHNPWTVSAGDSDQLRREADLLDKLKDSLRNAYVRKTGMEADRIAQMMDQETWLDAVEAVALGFADAIEEGVAAAATATPAQLRARFDTFAKAKSMQSQAETQPVAEPEVEILDTVVSENAPEIVEAPAAEPVVETVLEAEPTPEPEVIEPIESPVAKIAAADQILAKYNAALAERDGALAEARSYKAQLDTEREALQRLERSLGLSAARVVPVIDNASPEASDPVAEYIAAVEAGDRKTASALFEKHKAAIWQHRSKISKA